MSVSSAGIFTWGREDLLIDDVAPQVGRAVCVASGRRLAFRRVLEVRPSSLRVRCDVAPFDEVWDGEVVGCVRPRLIDRLAAIDPERWTRSNWHAAVAAAHLFAAHRRLLPRRAASFTTRVMEAEEWPLVCAFWRAACRKDLQLKTQPGQHVIGLFDKNELVGANIHLVFGTSSYAAFTLVDRRYRGTGGGKLMIDHAVSRSRELGLASIYVHINARNLPSLRAYQRAGFEKKEWWADESDPLASAERQWLVFEKTL